MDAPEVAPQAAPPDLLIAELRIFLQGSSTRHRTRFADVKLGFVEKRRLRRAANAAIHISKLAPSSLQSRRRASSATDAEMDACFEDRRIKHHA
jgi:hypothetical protein